MQDFLQLVSRLTFSWSPYIDTSLIRDVCKKHVIGHPHPSFKKFDTWQTVIATYTESYDIGGVISTPDQVPCSGQNPLLLYLSQKTHRSTLRMHYGQPLALKIMRHGVSWQRCLMAWKLQKNSEWPIFSYYWTWPCTFRSNRLIYHTYVHFHVLCNWIYPCINSSMCTLRKDVIQSWLMFNIVSESTLSSLQCDDKCLRNVGTLTDK